MKKSDKLLAKLSQSLDDHPTPTAAKTVPPAKAKPAPRKRAPRKAAATPPAAVASPRKTAPPPPVASTTSSSSAAPSRSEAATEAINRHLSYALGAGLIPVPLLDVASVTGVQLKLIASLSAIYDVPFSRHRAQAVTLALLGGAGSYSLAAGMLGSLAKALPGAGSLIGMSALPVTSAALTYAVGHVFRDHFESGGTLLDFDAAAMKQHFNDLAAEGRRVLGKASS